MNTYPEKIVNEEQLEELLSRPSAEAIEMFSRTDGDIMFLEYGENRTITLTYGKASL